MRMGRSEKDGVRGCDGEDRKEEWTKMVDEEGLERVERMGEVVGGEGGGRRWRERVEKEGGGESRKESMRGRMGGTGRNTLLKHIVHLHHLSGETV